MQIIVRMSDCNDLLHESNMCHNLRPSWLVGAQESESDEATVVRQNRRNDTLTIKFK